MITKMDLRALAEYAVNTFDYSADFEDDAFAVTFEGARVYVERKRSCFVLHIGSECHKLPRC